MPLDMNLLDASLVDRIFCNSFKRYDILKRSRPSMARSWRQASALPIYLMERWLGWTGWAGWDGLAGLGCQGHIVLLRNFIDFDSFWVNFCRMPLAKPSFFRIHLFFFYFFWETFWAGWAGLCGLLLLLLLLQRILIDAPWRFLRAPAVKNL